MGLVDNCLLVESHVRQFVSITAAYILAAGADPHGFILEIHLLVLVDMAMMTQIVGVPLTIITPIVHGEIS